MKTSIKKVDDTYIVCVEGNLDFENQNKLRENLNRLIDSSQTNAATKKIIFNLDGLNFVGSSGITSFIQTLKEVANRADTSPRYCNVRAEFQRLFRAFDNDEDLEFFESEEGARSSFDH